MIKNIIFDYDGTIADSVNIKTEAFAKLYNSYGDQIVKKVIDYHLSNGGVSRFDKIKFFHNEYLGIQISKSELDMFSKRFSDIVIDKVINSPYIEVVFQFIKENYSNVQSFMLSNVGSGEDFDIPDPVCGSNLEYFKVLNLIDSEIRNMLPRINRLSSDEHEIKI